MPLKIITLVWKLAQDRIPSKVNLIHRGILQSSSHMCDGCLVVTESTDHIFFECDAFSKVWMECLGWLGIYLALYKDCRSHFNQFQGLILNRSINRDVWQVIWSLWMARNNLVFKSKRRVCGKIMESVKFLSWQWIKTKKKGVQLSNF